ncbi:MAG: hypothetical protein IJU05_06495 [Schwartzia sp.]|nr:hypothetical protein [Schwartzia sp. (in: firmicutes)]
MTRFFKRLFERILHGIYWLMVLPFGLFLYIAAKGCVYLIASRYDAKESVMPVVLDVGIGGIVAIVLILIMSYALAASAKLTAAAFVALICVAFNGYFEAWRAWNGMTETPFWQAGLLTGISLITSLATWSELRLYRKRKLAEARAALLVPPKETEEPKKKK